MALTKRETRGCKPMYGKRMTRILRTPLTDEHWATLTLAAKLTGHSRAALVREALELHLPGLLLQRPEANHPTKTNAADSTPATLNNHQTQIEGYHEYSNR